MASRTGIKKRESGDVDLVKHDINVLFLEVETTTAKRDCLAILTTRYFLAGHRLLFAVDGEAAAVYLDQLLWTYPPEALLPHTVSDVTTTAHIVITKGSDLNLNGATLLFNIRAEAIEPPNSCREVIEFWDRSSAEREERSRLHKGEYERRGQLCRRHLWHPTLTDEELGITR